MRATVCCLALLACLVPGLAQNTACQNAATLPPKLAANLTASINAALLPKADNTYTNSTKSDYISFTTPKICYSGNWFGYHLIPSGCIPNVGGKTYQGSTGKTVSISGIYGLKVNITASQTSCSSANGVTTSTSAMTATATWPTIVMTTTLDWYPMVGGETGIGIKLTITGLKMVMKGSYTYAVTTATKQACFTAASVSSTTISYTSITGQWIIAGSPAGAVPGKVTSKIGSALVSKSTKVTNTVNTKLADDVVGTCKSST